MPILRSARHSNLAGHARAPRAREDGRPTISIVAVLRDESSAVTQHVAAQLTYWERRGFECVVVHAGARQIPGVSGPGRPDSICCVRAPADATEAQLRSLGLAAASGDVVMLVSDAGEIDERWVEHVAGLGTDRRQPSSESSSADDRAVREP